MRFILVVVALSPLAAFAQDMPLSAFTKRGEGWINPNRIEGVDYVDAFIFQQVRGNVRAELRFRDGGDKYTMMYKQGATLRDRPRNHPSGKITAVTRTSDTSTVYVAFDNDDSVWAFTPDKDNLLTNGAPYAPLRIRKAYDETKETRDLLKVYPPSLAVHELTLDTAGRLYAATSQDLQVFDPTGRLSGVLALPSKGKVTAMAWEGREKDMLAMWINGQKWTRAMKP